jgi:hypothetical protein
MPFATRCVWACGMVALLGSLTSAQEPKYWPLAKISFPVDVEKLNNQDPKPTKLRFYAAPSRGQFQLIAERSISELDELVDLNNKTSRRGFNYVARGDGLEEFALQFVYPNGDTVPATGNLAAQYRIVFDTRPPLVRISTPTATGVRWTIDDENLVSDSIKLEVKYSTQVDWFPVGTRAFSANDSYTWKDLPAGKVLEVRVSAKDKAGHEGRSSIVKLPTNSPGGGYSEVTPPKTSTGFGNPDDVANNSRPQIDYVNTNKLTVRSKLTKVTRSGVKEAILWVNDGKVGWKEDSRKVVIIGPSDKDPTIEMPYTAPRDGLYGFIVLPVNGAGGKPEDPREGDSAQWLVEVDTLKPTVEIKNVKVGSGGLNGPRVEIEWLATDKNMMPEPITLEYATDPNAKEWLPIAVKVSNSGKYVWEVEDKQVWKFWVRATAVDKAGNSDRVTYKDPVHVDLEIPAAKIEKVNGSGPPGAVRNYTPPVGTPTSAPSPPVVLPKVEQPPLPKPLLTTPPVIVTPPTDLVLPDIGGPGIPALPK